MSRIPFLCKMMLGTLGAAALLAGGCSSHDDEALLAYVASAGGNHIQVIDLGSGETLRRIYAGPTPWRLVVSPDGRQLWAQHWYSATTAVIDLEDHEVVGLLPERGPGIFTPAGDRFLTFSWPISTLTEYDPLTFEQRSSFVTEVPRVYDLALDPEASTLYMVQFDPMVGRARRIYSYILQHPYGLEDPSQAGPVSLPTGLGPRQVRLLGTEPFLLTPDGETNGLSLINFRRDGRAVPTCPGPRHVMLSPDETRMVVTCWLEEGSRTSQVVAYRGDFSTRPWPTLTQDPPVTLEGALTTGAFSPEGDRLYLADRTGARLLELDAETLQVLRELPTGALPSAVVVREVPARVRDQLLRGESRGRRVSREAIARLQAHSRPFTDLAWTETAIWYEPEPEVEGGEATVPSSEGLEEAPENGPDGSDQAMEEGEEPEMIERRRTLRHVLDPRGALRTTSEDGRIRVAEGGYSLSIEPDGRFWVAPRQELISRVYTLPNLKPDDALRALAGDSPDGPFLHTGIAIDVAHEATVDGERYYVLGAPPEGSRTSQLWIQVDSGRPINVVEQIPAFRAQSHSGGGFSGIVETRFLGYAEVGDGLWFPTQLERVTDGQWSMSVTLEGVEADQGLPGESFSLARLGGVGPEPPPGLFSPVGSEPSPDGPGRAVPASDVDDLESYRSPHPPYPSSPPTSGAHLYDIADWGVHEVPVPLPLQVHNLKEGGIAIQYNCARPCPALVARLAEIVRHHDRMLLAPYPWMEARIALTAWGRIETLETFDEERILRFVDAYGSRPPSESAVASSAPGNPRPGG